MVKSSWVIHGWWIEIELQLITITTQNHREHVEYIFKTWKPFNIYFILDSWGLVYLKRILVSSSLELNCNLLNSNRYQALQEPERTAGTLPWGLLPQPAIYGIEMYLRESRMTRFKYKQFQEKYTTILQSCNMQHLIC